MDERYRTQRIKRWTSRKDRESYPDWINPSSLQLPDRSRLNALVTASGEHTPCGDKIELYAKAGGELLLLRDKRSESSDGGIVALIAYSIVPSFNGTVGVVTEAYYYRESDDRNLDVQVSEAVNRHFAELGIKRHVTLGSPLWRRIPRMSEIRRVERLERSLTDRRDDDEDGPSTTQLPIPAKN